MQRWAEFVLKHRWWVVGFWVVVMVAGGVSAGQVNKRLTIDFSLPNEPGTVAAGQIQGAFGNGGFTTPYLVSVTLPGGIVGHEAEVARAFAAVPKAVTDRSLRLVDEATTGDSPAFRTDDGKTAYALLFYPFSRDPTVQLPTEEIRHALEAAKPAGATIGVTGEDALAVGDSSTGPGVLAETLIGAVGALAVLLFVFASALAFLPLVVAAVSIMTTFLLLLPLTYLSDYSFIVEFLIALIGLGVAIDYSLLFVTRWREERDHGRDNHDAVVIAMKTAGHAVAFSGITVAIGLIALVVLPVPFMKSVGVGGALIPLASVATTLSLTPAILGSIGPRIDWPKVRHENVASKGWTRWAQLVVKHRIVTASVAALALGALVVVFSGIKIGQSSVDSLATNGPAYDAYQVLVDGGVPDGALTPIEVLANADAAPAIAAQLGKVDGVADAFVSTAADSNRNGMTVVVVVPQHETVNSTSVETVKRVKDAASGLPGVLGIAGLGAAQIDFLHAVYGNFPLMLTLIGLLTFVLLVRAFRSVLLPIKAVVLNLLSLAATYGLLVLFWQKGYGSDLVFNISATGAVTFWIPMMVFAFLFGLSMDYEVFILSRMREEYDATGDTDRAVVVGIGRTGRLVTSAALILFFAFAALASGPGTDLKVMATGLAFGIVLDATIVRSLLVPSLVSLFGDWNWYLPDWLAKALLIKPSHAIHGAPAPEDPEPELVGAD